MSPGGLGRVLVVDDDPSIVEAVRRALERAGYDVDAATDAEQGWGKVERMVPDLIVCDVRLGEVDGLELLRRVQESYPEVAVIMMTGYTSIESAVGAIKAGAVDYLPKPFNPGQLRQMVGKAFEQRRLARENLLLRAELAQSGRDGIVVGQSRLMQQLFEVGRTVAAAESSVLITGDSGTGKEVLARFIHASSPRRDRPFVTVNCAAIPASLIESELFGHRRG
ncbi:MAG TPA: response regulator, partial [Vicinamibacteria bacterium]